MATGILRGVLRYFKVTLLLGCLSAAGVILLLETGMFRGLDAQVRAFFGLGTEAPPQQVLQYALVVALALGAAWTSVDIPRVSLKIVVAGIALAQLLCATWVAQLYKWYFSPFPGIAAVLFSTVAALVYAGSEGGRRKRVLRLLFGDRLARRSFYALINSPAPVRLDGEACEATAVVCEIVNHDDLADALTVAECVALTNRFLAEASELLVEAGGYLDECDGEGVRVIFGAPLADEQHAVRACEAALALAGRLEAINGELAGAARPVKLDWRIGINSGEMIGAAYGSRRLGAFSVSGDAVEFARRLCAANVVHGTRILIGAGTFALAAGAIEVRPIDLLYTGDAHHREELYELLARKGGLSAEESARRDLFWKGMVYYREQLREQALAHFLAARPPDTVDLPLERYIARLEKRGVGRPAPLEQPTNQTDLATEARH